MIKIKLDLEKILLLLFFAILLFIGPGSLFEHKIRHDFPYGYFASDAFQHQVRAEAIKDAGNFRYEAVYISKGFEKVVGRYPPVIYHLAVIFSYTSGLQTYDSIYLLTVLFSIVAVFVIYLIIANFNKNIALISLPFSMIMISPPSYINSGNSLILTNTGFSIALIWGHWPSLLSQMFLLAFFWSILKINLEKSYIMISLLLAAIVMTHTSEAVFAAMFLILSFGIKLISKKLDMKEIKVLIIAFVISFAITLYYLIIFKNTLAKTETYSFAVAPIWDGNPGFYIMGFGILLIFMIAGIIFSLFKIKNMHISLVLAFTMLIGGFLNYIGFSLRSFQIRFFWPLYLSVFFGFGVYMLFKFIVKKWNMMYTLAILAIFTVLLSGLIKIPLVPYYKATTSQGLMDQHHWAALTWLSKKTEPNAKIYFFYGDIYSQDALLRNSKRIHYQVDTDDFVKSIKDRKIKRTYVSELPGDSGGSLAVRISPFKLKDATEGLPSEYFFGLQDICKFNYIVLDKPQNERDIKIYNRIIESDLLKKDFIQKVFENEVVIILKNNKIGDDCIEERSF